MKIGARDEHTLEERENKHNREIGKKQTHTMIIGYLTEKQISIKQIGW